MPLEEKIRADLWPGVRCERLFCRIAGASLGDERDEERHVDCWWRGRAIDVKGRKAGHESGYLLLEFRNVMGAKGWMYGGADAIAFLMLEGFLVVGRRELLAMAMGLIDLRDKVHRQNKVDPARWVHRLLGRVGRRDVFTYVERGRVEMLPHVWVRLDGSVEVYGKGD